MEKQSSTQRARGGYLEALLNSCPDAVLAINAEGIITFANKEACKLTEREMRELVGQSILVAYENLEAARETNRKLFLSGGIIHDHESRVKTKSGKIVPVRISASHLKDSAGNYIGAVGYFATYRPWPAEEAKTKAYAEELESKLEEWKDMGAPIYELLPGLTYVVIVGRLDAGRLRHITDNLLSNMKVYKTAAVRIDLASALINDPASVAAELLKTIRTVRLLGAESILTGIDTSLARSLESAVTDTSSIKAFVSRDAAFEAAIKIIGYEVRKKS